MLGRTKSGCVPNYRRQASQPDLAAAGVDLQAFPIVQVDDRRQAMRVADMLMRSGGFALVILDNMENTPIPLPIQTRLSGLAKRYNTLLLVIPGHCRTVRERSMASLASLRAVASQKRFGHGLFLCELSVEKDKRHSPGWSHKEIVHGTDGLC